LSIQNNKVDLWRYNLVADNTYAPEGAVDLDTEALENFFYTVAINYSHYGLNSTGLKNNWIEPLFHKNDAYQAPLVINPMRTRGNVDVNVENDLVKARLLSNILEQVEDNSDGANIRTVTDSGRSVERLSLKLNQKKLEFLYEDEPYPVDHTDIVLDLKPVFGYFEIAVDRRKPYAMEAELYIYKKLLNICRNYSHYGQFYDLKKERLLWENLDDLLLQLNADQSHVTYKLRQALNFLKYRHFDNIKIGNKNPISVYSDAIQNVIETYPERNLKIIELLPPSFFSTKLEMDGGIDFELLSSGEKQRIYSVSSLIYHLNNISSVSRSEGLVKYPYVNVIFDEVELYFHPDMQRTFIDYLLTSIKRANLTEIDAINICFATHSPFILSDIPNNNVMFLRREGTDRGLELGKSVQTLERGIERLTFGANIHELLATRFFLDQHGLIGELSKKRIRSAINYLEAGENANDVREMEWTKESVRTFIDIIGEPLIHNGLMDLYTERFLNTESEIDEEIERLRIRKLKIKPKKKL
jgi:hypothetical protein